MNETCKMLMAMVTSLFNHRPETIKPPSTEVTNNDTFVLCAENKIKVFCIKISHEAWVYGCV